MSIKRENSTTVRPSSGFMKLAPSVPFQMWILICLAFVAVTVAEYAAVLFLMRQHRRRRQRRALAVKALVMQVGGVATKENLFFLLFLLPHTL